MADLSAPAKGEEGLLAQLDRAVDELRRVIRRLDADLLTGAEAERLMRPLAAGRNVCDAGLATLAARVEQSGRWKQAGAPTPGVHLGSLTGGSAGSGNKLLGASRHLEAAPEARRALGEGKLSLDQAAEIAGAVAETAGSSSPEVASRAADVEAHLLEVAAAGNLATLRRESDRARQAARDEAEVRRRQHQSRYLRRRRFGDGSVGAELKLPALVGGQVLAVLDKLTERRFNEMRAAGVREPREAYAADALCRGLGVAPSADPDHPRDRVQPDEGRGPDADHPRDEALPDEDRDPGRERDAGAGSVRAELIVVVDADTLRNGRVGPGGMCEIPGVGPVPVEAAQELLGEAGVDLVVREGHDVAHVTCGGRRLSKGMRVAMLVQGDWECDDCGATFRLQADHDIPYALSRRTRLRDLRPRCPTCHGRKTKREASDTIAAGREWRQLEEASRARVDRLLVGAGAVRALAGLATLAALPALRRGP